jgi:uncharacterized cupin superfamily protein
MPTIIKQVELKFEGNKAALPQFNWHTCTPRLAALANSKHLIFDVRSLDAGKYSYPYHFHRNSEEIFVIFSGSATLRAPNGLHIVNKGEIIFFELGETGAHQLYNHTNEPCIYLDIRTSFGLDVTEYPDSGKINFAPNHGVYEKQSKVDYFKGEENVGEIWKTLKK